MTPLCGERRWNTRQQEQQCVSDIIIRIYEVVKSTMMHRTNKDKIILL